MTEAEWLTTTDPNRLLLGRRETLEKRKRRLFECACCRRVWQHFCDERSRRAVLAAEEHVEEDFGQFSQAISDDAWQVIEEELDRVGPEANWFERDVPYPYSTAAFNITRPMGWWGAAPAYQEPSKIIRERVDDPSAEALAQCVLLRDIFGNPFRPVTFDPAWRTEAVVGLARGIYEERAFERMPILADALQEAGCDNADILTHCREPGTHVRGCWVVDLVLGKA